MKKKQKTTITIIVLTALIAIGVGWYLLNQDKQEPNKDFSGFRANSFHNIK